MRVFKTKWFARYAKQEDIDDKSLTKAIKQAEKGLIDAKLGGDLVKIRVARKGQGSSSGYRTLIAYKRNERAVFLFGFAKSERENIEDDELKSLKEIASSWIKAGDEEISISLSDGLLKEISYE